MSTLVANRIRSDRYFVTNSYIPAQDILTNAQQSIKSNEYPQDHLFCKAPLTCTLIFRNVKIIKAILYSCLFQGINYQNFVKPFSFYNLSVVCFSRLQKIIS